LFDRLLFNRLLFNRLLSQSRHRRSGERFVVEQQELELASAYLSILFSALAQRNAGMMMKFIGNSRISPAKTSNGLTATNAIHQLDPMDTDLTKCHRRGRINLSREIISISMW
jgi:hypothetical protein